MLAQRVVTAVVLLLVLAGAAAIGPGALLVLAAVILGLACFEWPFGDGRHPTSRYALVAAEPVTGRRNQVRRHFKHIAHPLVGDTTHGKGAHNRAVAAWLGVQRLWLHCEWMELPGGVRVSAPCGAEWRPLLAAVR